MAGTNRLFIPFLCSLLFCCACWAQQSSVAEKPSQEMTMTQVTQALQSVAQGQAKQSAQIQQIAYAIDKFAFVFDALKKSPAVKEAIETAEKEWQARIDVVNQQKAIIEQQQKKIAEQDAELAKLKVDKK